MELTKLDFTLVLFLYKSAILLYKSDILCIQDILYLSFHHRKGYEKSLFSIV
jgi:hypothetical protein